MQAALLKSGRMDWNTPAEILDLVRTFNEHRQIGLDPCTNAQSSVNAFHTLPDGLVGSWLDKGLVYVNPPYGRALKAWAEKIVREAREGAEILALVPSRTDTKWFQALFNDCDAVCFWRGRITFEGAPHPAPFPSALFYFGAFAQRFHEVFSQYGIVL